MTINQSKVYLFNFINIDELFWMIINVYVKNQRIGANFIRVI